MRVYTVTQVNNYIKKIIENDLFLHDIYIEAEISNLKLHSSGHMYFTLKDKGAAINCVMFKSHGSSIKFTPSNGMNVLAKGYISVYEKTGQYQLYVNNIEPAGIGALYMAYEQLKAKLDKSGVFDAKYKKDIPSYPKCIAVVTSPTGAALRDIIKVAKSRNPNVEIVVAPALVQGENAKDSIVEAIEMLNRWNKADVIILGRGGGSIEDLWAFNEECVARAIFDSNIPIITAIGHETDYTIADFISDKRAATPSQAAEMAVPASNAIESNIKGLYNRMDYAISSVLKDYRYKYNDINNRYVFKNFEQYIYDNQIYIEEIYNKINSIISTNITKNKLMLKNYIDNLENKSPLNILQKGYSLVTDGAGNIIKSANELGVGDEINIRLNQGRVNATVNKVGD